MRQVNDAFIAAKNLRLVNLIYLYEILYDPEGNNYLRYTSYGKAIVFKGHEFIPYVIHHDNLSEDLSGKAVKTNIEIGNMNREIQALVDTYDLEDKEVRIYMVAEEDISNPDAYLMDVFRVTDYLADVTKMTLRCSTPSDALDRRIPRRYFFRGYCRFRFKGVDCQYAGSVGDCEKNLQKCRQLNNSKHFGAFPATPNKQIWINK